MRGKNIDYNQITAGKHKRTLNLIAEQSPEGIENTKIMVNKIHKDFIDLVSSNRNNVKIDIVKEADI